MYVYILNYVAKKKWSKYKYFLKKVRNNNFGKLDLLESKLIIRGLTILLKGRLRRRRRKAKDLYVYGSTPFNNLNANIEFAQDKLVTKRGVYGLKVWVHYY